MATAALLRTWTRVRPGWSPRWLPSPGWELAAWRSPLFGGNLLSFHLSGWAMIPITHPHVDVAFWRMVFEAPVGLPLGVLLGAAQHMLHSDHATRGCLGIRGPSSAPPPATPAPAARSPALERMPPFVDDAPALGAVYDGELPARQHGPYAVLPRELRGRAITLAGAPGVRDGAAAAPGRRRCRPRPTSGVHRRQGLEPTWPPS